MMPGTLRTTYPQKNGATQSHLGYRLFLKESLRTIRVTASVCPSSRFLTTAMLDAVDFRNVRTLVELGSGTGVITQEILRRMMPDARLFALEINLNFVEHLRASWRDRRLTVLHADASDLLSQLHMHDAGSVHAVVSSLGLTGMRAEQRARIVQQVEACLVPAGIMTQFQYLTSMAAVPNLPSLQIHRFQERRFLRNYFRSVSEKRVLLNLPPAVVFTCRK